MRRLLAGLCLLFIVLPAAAAEAPGKGRLWRVERPGSDTSYLFGTMHSSDPTILALPGSVLRALHDSRSVVGELVIKDVNYAVMMASAMLPAGESLAELLPASLYEHVLEAVAVLGLPPAVADRLDVWFLALLLTEDPAEIARQRAGYIVLDQWLQQEGERQGKQVMGLETMEEQLAIFAGWPRALQIAMLRTTLDYPGLLSGSQAALVALWLDGDLPSMWRLFQVSMLGTATQYRDMMVQDLVLKRNHLMAERLQPILAEGGAFVAVGALHLAGSEGLVVLLQDLGWTVTPVD